MDKSNHSIGSGLIQLTTYDPAKIPICWKCASAITQVNDVAVDSSDVGYIWNTTMVLVGCREHAEIKNYEDAKRLCPLLVRQ